MFAPPLQKNPAGVGNQRRQRCYPVQMVVTDVGNLGAIPLAVVPACNTLSTWLPVGSRRRSWQLLLIQVRHQTDRHTDTLTHAIPSAVILPCRTLSTKCPVSSSRKSW